MNQACLSAILIAGVCGLSLASQPPPDDTAILKALLTDVIEPLREKYQPPRTIVLDRMSLARCPTSVVRACIVQSILDQSRREAALGSWGFDLAAAFERHAADRVDLRPRFGAFTHRNLLFDASDEIRRAHPTPLPLAISQPFVVDGQSLMVVQFARTWTWLLLLSRDASGWHVTKTITVGVS